MDQNVRVDERGRNGLEFEHWQIPHAHEDRPKKCNFGRDVFEDSIFECRPVVFKAKAKAKDLEASDFCDEG